jgi:hypothetical protein
MHFYYKPTLFVVTLLLFITGGMSGTAFASDDESSLHVGGAVRYNIYMTDYESDMSQDSYQFTWDTWRINVVYETAGGIGLNFEYRFYPTFNTHFVKQGWLQYNFTEATQVQLGVTQVPFGNLMYNSHNWWFQAPYYVGLEDDFDMGIKLLHSAGNWNLAFAYFMQSEPSGPAYGAASFGTGGAGRYSYDIIPITGGSPWDYVLGPGETPQSNREINHFNARATYTMSHGDLGNTEIGFSGQYGSIYNSVLEQSEGSTAFAAHLDGYYGNFNVKAQFTHYDYAAVNDDGDEVEYVYMAAYGDPYPVAKEASIYTLGIAYSWNVDWGPVSNLQFYNNYSLVDKANSDFHDTHQNVLGFLLSAGNVFTYFDIAMGKNHPWLTDAFGVGLGSGLEDAEWNTRFNINIGYYF